MVERIGEDDGATAHVLALYADAVGRYLAIKLPRARTRGTLDDIVQEVLLGLMERPGVLGRARRTAGGHFRYLLMHVAYNAARNAERKLGDRRALVAQAVAEWEATTINDPDEGVDRAWAQSLLQSAWNELRAWVRSGDEQADCLAVAEAEAHLIHGRNLREIAIERGLGLGTCHRRLARARTLPRTSILDHLRATGEIADEAGGDETVDLLLASAAP
ncbi:MAG: RNA polymerase sigma factor [Planctomycetota bacterium]